MYVFNDTHDTNDRLDLAALEPKTSRLETI